MLSQAKIFSLLFLSVKNYIVIYVLFNSYRLILLRMLVATDKSGAKKECRRNIFIVFEMQSVAVCVLVLVGEVSALSSLQKSGQSNFWFDLDDSIQEELEEFPFYENLNEDSDHDVSQIWSDCGNWHGKYL